MRGAAAARWEELVGILLLPQRGTGFEKQLQPALQAHPDECRCLVGKWGVNLRLQGNDEKWLLIGLSASFPALVGSHGLNLMKLLAQITANQV